MFIVQEPSVAYILAGSSLVLTVVVTVLNAMFAFSLDSAVPAIRILAMITFATTLLAICGLAFLILGYIPKLKDGSAAWSTALFWRYLGLCITAACLAALLSFITLVWTAARITEFTQRIAGDPPRAILIAWFTLWGVSATLQIGTYTFMAGWTNRALYSRSLAAMDLDFGLVSPEMRQSQAQAPGSSDTPQSQGPTPNSPPQTPTTKGLSGPFRMSQSRAKGGPTSSRTRLVRGASFAKDSAKSSLDYTSGEAVSAEHPFDDWDTSSVTGEVRSTLHSTPGATRLETIPGSRAQSPAKALEGPFLPDSPLAPSSEAATVVVEGGVAYSSPKASISSPPSSSPNFSRPASKQLSQSVMASAVNEAMVETTPEKLIHPLFRPGSPLPAPVATTGTVVTASPLAGQSITPKTLTRMRSVSILPQPSPLKDFEVPLPEADSAPATPEVGSPGPSILEDEDLPPILPGFILSAGSRSSLVGYGKRKSVKSRPASSHSQGEEASTDLS